MCEAPLSPPHPPLPLSEHSCPAASAVGILRFLSESRLWHVLLHLPLCSHLASFPDVCFPAIKCLNALAVGPRPLPLWLAANEDLRRPVRRGARARRCWCTAPCNLWRPAVPLGCRLEWTCYFRLSLPRREIPRGSTPERPVSSKRLLHR